MTVSARRLCRVKENVWLRKQPVGQMGAKVPSGPSGFGEVCWALALMMTAQG